MNNSSVISNINDEPKVIVNIMKELKAKDKAEQAPKLSADQINRIKFMYFGT